MTISWDDVGRRFADLVRPACILGLGVSVGVAPFVHADFALASLSAAAFGGLVGARSFENNAQIKAAVATSTATAQVATADKVTTVTSGVQPSVAPATAAPAPTPEPPHKMG